MHDLPPAPHVAGKLNVANGPVARDIVPAPQVGRQREQLGLGLTCVDHGPMTLPRNGRGVLEAAASSYRLWTVDERTHAFRLYHAAGVSRRKAERAVAAFIAKGFVLRDIGGGDTVWQATYAIRSRRKPDITVQVRAGAHGGLVTDLGAPVGIVVEHESGGVQFWSNSARLFLDSFSTFNARPVGD